MNGPESLICTPLFKSPHMLVHNIMETEQFFVIFSFELGSVHNGA